MTEHPASRVPVPLWPLLALLIGGIVFFCLMEVREQVVDATREALRESVPHKAEAATREMDLPMERVEHLTPLGGEAACITGARHLACTEDGGETWTPYADLPEHVLAVARLGSETLAAVADGSVYAVTPELAQVRAAAPAGLTVVDAADHHGSLWLLAHAYSRPPDALHLPVVVKTELLEFGSDGELTERGSIPGFGGDRLLLQGETVATFAVYDTLAYRSTDGGRTFRKVSAREPLAADYDGLLATVERRTEKLPGGGGAQPASTLYVSSDAGASWDVAFSAPGELVVEFADARHGIVIARNEGAAYLTSDGGHTFQLASQDDALASAVDVARLGDTWLAVTADARAIVRLGTQQK